MTYICLECGRTFDEPMSWVEKHGFRDGPGEQRTGCPSCAGAYCEAAYCDECGKPVMPDELCGGHYCRDCLTKATDNTFLALEYLEDSDYLLQFVFETLFDSTVPAVVSHNLRVWTRDTFLRMDRDGLLRKDSTFRSALKYFILEADGELGRDCFAEWLARYNAAKRRAAV